MTNVPLPALTPASLPATFTTTLLSSTIPSGQELEFPKCSVLFFCDFTYSVLLLFPPPLDKLLLFLQDSIQMGLFFFLATPHGMWALSSPTRD